MSGLFRLENIHFSWPGRDAVLCGANMQLDAGERVCMTGYNGAGKSTLLHIMVGLLKPSSGKVIAFGHHRQKEADFFEVRRRVGLVFQDADDQLFCPTVAEDVAFGPLNCGKSRDQALAIVGKVLLDLGIAHFRDRVTHKLSGGEKRLVSLATVLAMEPDVLLLDEPTTALDERATQRLIEIVQQLPQAMVIISHDRHFRRQVATRSISLIDGVLDGPEAT
ncbi:MAG: ABC transporter ATP-binding protein [Cohaesibacteraceae bacterium]|nr:ABC transporter ATP-binding protein [Cohaesibacteraceae bacterium]